MRYVQLRAFHHVAVHGGFSRAAEMLHLTQPAVSDQVRKLEEEYEVILFNRRKKQVSLTATGKRLLEVTHRFFEVETQALELLSESRALSAGSLRIVADSAMHLLHILQPFQARHPRVRVSVRAGNSQEVIEALYSYETDVGVLGEIPDSRDFQAVRLSTTPLIAFAAASAAPQRPLTLRELARHPLVLREPGSKTRQKLEQAARERGLELKAAIEAEGREAIREIVASGAGIGFVSQAEFGHDPRLVAIPIAGEDLTMDEALICLRERAGGKLVSAFMEMAARLSGEGVTRR
ncbi:MAG: LysR family transcriptional regulator [Alphaproteobacteria bacterium]|nr:MAG: LysR family transcriptional regulator [Alphaproteobacteria bacterium]